MAKKKNDEVVRFAHPRSGTMITATREVAEKMGAKISPAKAEKAEADTGASKSKSTTKK